jgi:hypothetical protein
MRYCFGLINKEPAKSEFNDNDQNRIVETKKYPDTYKTLFKDAQLLKHRQATPRIKKPIASMACRDGSSSPNLYFR